MENELDAMNEALGDAGTDAPEPKQAEAPPAADAQDATEPKKTEKAPVKKPEETKAESAARKRKVKRQGAEVEVDLDDEESILRMLSDDDEEEIEVDGRKQRLTRADLRKDYMSRERALTSQAEARQKLEQFSGWKQKLTAEPELLKQFLQDELGIERPFAPLEAEYMNEIRLMELKDPSSDKYDPAKWEEAIAQRERAKFEREQARTRKQEEAQKAQQAQAELAARYRKELPVVLREHGLSPTNATMALMRQATESLRGAGRPTTDLKEVAYEAKRMLLSEVSSLLSGLSPKALRDMLGPKALKALKDAEVADATAAQKAAATANNPRTTGDGASRSQAPKKRVRLKDL